MSAPDAFVAVVHAVEAAGGTILGRQDPETLEFTLRSKHWANCWLPVGLRGQATVQPQAAGTSHVTMRLSVIWSDTVMVWGMMGGLSVMLLMCAPMLVLMIPIGLGLQGLFTGVLFPKETGAAMLAKLGPGGSSPSGSSVWTQLKPALFPSVGGGGGNPPPPAPAPAPAPAPPELSPAEASKPIVEQIKQLAELKQMGAITEEEFEAKKTELLKRI